MHNKSNSTLQLIKDKSNNLQIFLRYFIGLVTSMFNVGTDGCATWSASLSFPGCASLASAFLDIFCLTPKQFTI